MSLLDFPACSICSADDWTVSYHGPVRDGPFGATREGQITRCGGCGVERLAESLCLTENDYRGGDYRTHVGQNHELTSHFATHDVLARFTLDVLWPTTLRGKVVADVGCGGGSLLDHIRGLPQSIVAIDPDEKFAPSLRERGYRYYPTAAEAARDFRGHVDVAFLIQVIEHVVDPRAFLAETRQLLAPDGVLVLSTPNRADILMELLPNDFPSFFYRTQHRWYFDAGSLQRCAEAAGYRSGEIRHVHRYGMANALLWLRDRKPAGRQTLTAIDTMADNAWRSFLEMSGRGDNLYMLLKTR